MHLESANVLQIQPLGREMIGFAAERLMELEVAPGPERAIVIVPMVSIGLAWNL